MDVSICTMYMQNGPENINGNIGREAVSGLWVELHIRLNK